MNGFLRGADHVLNDQDDICLYSILVLCSGNILTKSFDLFQDRISSGGPNKWFGIRVILVDKLIDLGDQIFDTFESAPSYSPLGDDVEPNINLV